MVTVPVDGKKSGFKKYCVSFEGPKKGERYQNVQVEAMSYHLAVDEAKVVIKERGLSEDYVPIEVLCKDSNELMYETRTKG